MNIVIERDIPLRHLTTLGVGGSASHVVRVQNEEELRDAVLYAKGENLPLVVLGGGSNVFFPDAGIRALVVMPHFMVIGYREVSSTVVHVTAGAGVLLDDLVADTVRNNVWGLENLSSIPGTVGGMPIQNVGAYGVEAKDFVESVSVFDIDTMTSRRLNAHECTFGYRTSIFKTERGKRYIVLGVTCALTRTPAPHIGYKDLALRFAQSRDTPSQKDIREAVIEIRRTKFPDWHTLGTAGSFFKNPIITKEHFAELSLKYPGIPGFPHEEHVKVALGWVLDHVLHLKGIREGNVGLFEAQALVLVRYGEATADEIIVFSDRVIQKIFDATGIQVEREVVYIS